jgi:4-hydroxy-4-methyl-2-oxoglutarate aldolase
VIERLAAIPYTGALSDILDEMGYRHQVLPPGIQPLAPGQTIVGRALTVTGRPLTGHERDDYFRPFLTMLGAVQPGDVIVIQPHDHAVAHFGELSAEAAKLRGGRGVIIDGGIRDVDYVLKLGFPVFARYTTPKDIIGRWMLEEFNLSITIGDTRIDAGDYIVGDRDGVLAIPQTIAEKAVATAEEVVHTENQVRKAVLEGVPPLEAYEKFGRF